MLGMTQKQYVEKQDDALISIYVYTCSTDSFSKYEIKNVLQNVFKKPNFLTSDTIM